MNALGALLDAHPGCSQSSAHGENVVEKRLLDTVVQMLDALAAEDERGWEAVSRVLREDDLLLGELEAHLPSEARIQLLGLVRYGHCWTLFRAGRLYSNPNPHEVIAARRAGREYEPKPARPAPWLGTARRRGMLRGFLNQVVEAMSAKRRRREPVRRERGESLDQQAVSAVELLEDPDGGHYKPGWSLTDVAAILGVAHSALSGKQRDGSPRCPKFQELRERRRKAAAVRRQEARRRNT